MSTESLEFKSSLDSSAFARGLRNMEEGANKAGSKIASSFESMAKGGVASLAAAFSVGAIVSFGQSLLDFAGDLQDSSDALGITTDALQGLNAVFEAGGSDAETTKKGLTTLIRSLEDIATAADGPARKALDALGISFQDIAGLSADEVMYVIAEAMKNATDKGAALDAAMTLLGKSASKMAPALYEGAEAMKKMAKDANKVSAPEIKLFADFGDKVGEIFRDIKVDAIKAINVIDSLAEDINESGMNDIQKYKFRVSRGQTGRIAADTSAGAFEAESTMTAEELANEKTVIASPVKAPVDPRIQAEQEAKISAIEKEAAAMEKAVAARDKATADSAAAQLTLSEQLQEAGVKMLELQDYIASSEGIDQVNAQTELINLKKTELDLIEKVAKAKADEAKKEQDLFQQNLDRENAAKADAFKDEMDKQKKLQEVNKDRAEEALKLADDDLAKAKQGLEDVFTGKVKKPTKAETKLAAQISTAMGEDVVQANKFGAEGGLGTKQLDATGKVIKGLGSTGGLGGGARKDMPKGSAEAIARFNKAKERQEAAKGNLVKTNEILDLINKGINGAK